MKFLIALIAMSPIFTFAQHNDVISLHKSQIEALQTKDGTYTRFEDISEGIVSINGVTTDAESIIIDLKKSVLDSIILENGSRLKKVFLNKAAVVIGGDMGGGGTAN